MLAPWREGGSRWLRARHGGFVTVSRSCGEQTQGHDPGGRGTRERAASRQPGRDRQQQKQRKEVEDEAGGRGARGRRNPV